MSWWHFKAVRPFSSGFRSLRCEVSRIFIGLPPTRDLRAYVPPAPAPLVALNILYRCFFRCDYAKAWCAPLDPTWALIHLWDLEAPSFITSGNLFSGFFRPTSCPPPAPLPSAAQPRLQEVAQQPAHTMGPGTGPSRGQVARDHPVGPVRGGDPQRWKRKQKGASRWHQVKAWLTCWFRRWRWPGAKKCRWPPAAGKGEGKDPEPREESSPRWRHT